MIYPKIPLAQTVIQLCKAKNIQHIVISPGSRNAPLTLGFTNDDFFKCYSIVDERSAAFFALGIAQQLKHPVALVCTSGSALLNYYPAISEAFYSDIPLIVMSADRPKHLIDIGDGQTINQKFVFENHILYSANLKLDLKDEKNIPENEELPIMKNLEDKLERFLGFQKDIQSHNEFEINTAINNALMQSGPVHVNIPFDEPLYETVDKLTVEPKASEVVIKPKQIDSYTLQECLEYWNSYSKKMILVGVNAPNQIEQRWLDEIAKDDSVIVFTETTSNLHEDSFFPSIDQMIAPLSEDEQKQLQPDVLLTFGGLIVSKKIKALLRKFQPKHHWHIDKKRANDTFFCLSMHVETTPNHFFETVLPKITHYVKSNYKDDWSLVRKKRLEKHESYLKAIPYSDFKVFDVILKSIPDNSILQVGNSSAIRYTQLFSINKTLEVFCNRGTSGIDGCTSTAVGCAAISNKPTVFITGDLSFLYDSNGLWNNYIPNNFRIIVINNQGGGIFRILPGQKNTDNFDYFFETKHNLNAKHLSNMYGFEYASAKTERQLKNKLQAFYSESEEPKLLEVFTPRTINDEVLLSYFEYIK
ncbi:2-succinyl-5-enolpyruvyl-6-hydroxy-3-cyclohexene-1-carboxylate synthase [Yeosuana aromativorans]|uniref:2-succinyl-5-enolpyruvyl-6-hydroxy-3-cyclohexene-1-carboxylate synthase n=1 Tax=Yeosuana aromativorans TaxID=288019 RepID=A0A8J3BNH8_9FLAO|nr:thiamine pyrophosphate-binding protein [Yeosuana aromativorans]GGK16349.1 2-succinyl-5-enolpyruvyl-6-hydroxy-3-cyclohexene-1-carboxylate synthase [Yeosuana aromativorans]